VPEGRLVELSEGSTFVVDVPGPHRDAPTIVLLHALGCTAYLTWFGVLGELSQTHRVVALDLRWHGRGIRSPRFRISECADDVAGVLDALGIPRAAVGGHSLGGAVALTLALERPGRVAGLVLVATGARLRVAPEALALSASPEGLALAARAMADRSFGPGASEAVREARAREIAATPRGLLHSDLAACDAFDVMARVGELRLPALVVCGTDDRLTPPKYAAFLAERIAGARLVLVPGAGHLVMLERPDEVAAALADFLATPVRPA
jgi:pimeloyl-ACP methyl ester carboxylesterase